MRDLPVPGKLHVLRSTQNGWSEMGVDYRAEGLRAVMAAAPGGSVWVATDMGMILEWQAGLLPEQK